MKSGRPNKKVDLLLLPVSAPWLKISECIDFARDVKAPRSLAIHDAIYSETGHQFAGMLLDQFLGAREQTFTRIASGQDL